MLHTYELGIVSMGKFIDLLSLSHSLLAVGTVNCLSTHSTPFTSLIACSRNWLIMQQLCQMGQKIHWNTIGYNAMYVEGIGSRDIHIFAYNFLNIQLIFNPIKVLEN